MALPSLEVAPVKKTSVTSSGMSCNITAAVKQMARNTENRNVEQSSIEKKEIGRNGRRNSLVLKGVDENDLHTNGTCNAAVMSTT
nr:hypothetical protein DM860_016384 [Ipomoea batatas]GMD79021.1 hypothetical protein DM860_016384 [Ipomoea batatas]